MPCFHCGPSIKMQIGQGLLKNNKTKKNQNKRK